MASLPLLGLGRPVFAPGQKVLHVVRRVLLRSHAEGQGKGQAHRPLSAADQRRWSKAQFAALFSDLSDVTVAVPTGTIEGAAGSSYYTAPVSITGSDADGRPVAYTGEVVLRRVNDVPGATPKSPASGLIA